MPALSITKRSLRGVLRSLDRSDPAATDRFLNLFTDICSATPETVSASAMTDSELVKLFFTNSIFVQLGTPVSTTTLTPQRTLLLLNAFGEVSLKPRVYANHDYVLSGRADFAIGYGTTEHGGSPIDSYLILVDTKHAGTFAVVWLQMMACVRMVHRNYVKGGKQNATVYGICSDGMRYRFVAVGNNGLLWKSPELSIVSQRTHVYSYVQHILSAAEFSTPSISPTKVGEKRESEIRKFEVKRKYI
ncbi:hypothetical protein Q9L58_006264 [Maublancomyces gigas]|uniref:Uncharacterized protein n=1 Tax=Discina gigas TaxID=1032678 RepID=A0ABR3GG44_9PEZI